MRELHLIDGQNDTDSHEQLDKLVLETREQVTNIAALAGRRKSPIHRHLCEQVGCVRRQPRRGPGIDRARVAEGDAVHMQIDVVKGTIVKDEGKCEQYLILEGQSHGEGTMEGG